MSGVEMPLAPSGTYGRYDTVSHLNQVLFLGNSVVGNVPVKEVTFYNNTKYTTYPFLYDPNTGQSTTGGYYDPFDPNNEEYRAYIGYTENGKDYLGLQSGHSITINVPLVFWDSGRTAVATDASNLLPTDLSTNKNSPITNPFFFFYKNLDGTDTARFVSKADKSTGNNGIVMFYHVSDANAPVNPGADAPEQLLEFTIRDKAFLTEVSDKVNKIDPSQLITLINYDVSYVDHLLLPVAMEATGVPVPNTSVKADYGWIGASQTYLTGANSLQASIQKFTSNSANNGLGTYFQKNGKSVGWPTYFNPNYSSSNQEAGLRIPGGANILFSSPLANIRSSYSVPYGASNHWMLSSGGTGPIQYALGGNFKAPNQALIASIPGLDKILEGLQVGMQVTANGVNVGQIQSVDVANRLVTLTASPNIPDGTPETFVFSNPASDPYAKAITRLWYSWAAYYQSQFSNFTPQQITANISTDTDNSNSDYRVLTFAQPQPQLAVGMQVTGGGITGLTTIIKIANVNGVQTVYLSAPVPGVSAPTEASLTFSAPQPIAYASEVNKLLPLTFGAQQQAYAKEFAATVYEIMSVFSTAPRKVPLLPASMELVGNSIGGNVGFLPTALPINYVNISANVRDLVKSALRGVPDFVTYGESSWYPAPSTPTGGQTFNVYNLDPYVWFIHKELGLSGDGFSFDADTADVGANGTSTLSIALGGLGGLSNTSAWSPSTQWGTVKSLATITQGTGANAGETLISLADSTVFNQLNANDPANSVVGAYVSGPGIPAGTNLAKFGLIDQNQFVLSKNAPSASNVLLTFTGKPQSALTRRR